MAEEYIRPAEIKAASNGLITTSGFYKLNDSGVFPNGTVVRIGRKLFVNREKLHAWIESGGGGFEGGWRKANGDAAVDRTA